METVILSIIVPVYNGKKFLKKCVHSILEQTYKNYELILVDDGSTDNSGLLCDTLATEDLRIKVIHQQNQGVSSARNNGINVAIGKYIFFCDVDDWLPKTSIETLIKATEVNKSDFTAGSALEIGITRQQPTGFVSNNTCSVNKTDAFIEFINQLKSVLGPWGKIFKTEIIRRNQLQFQEEIKYGEDRIFIWNYLRNCHIVTGVSEIVYFYSKLNLNNACSKYYPSMNCWLEMSLSSFRNLLDDEEWSKEKALNSLLASTKKMLVNSFTHYYSFLKKETAKQKYEETRILFHKQVSFVLEVCESQRLKNPDQEFLQCIYLNHSDDNSFSEKLEHTLMVNRQPLKIMLRTFALKIYRDYIYI